MGSTEGRAWHTVRGAIAPSLWPLAPAMQPEAMCSLLKNLVRLLGKGVVMMMRAKKPREGDSDAKTLNPRTVPVALSVVCVAGEILNTVRFVRGPVVRSVPDCDRVGVV